jgi:colicin import membrane protein
MNRSALGRPCRPWLFPLLLAAVQALAQQPAPPGAASDPARDAEEAQLRIRKMENYHKAMAERAAQRAAEAERQAAERAEAERQAALAAAQRAAEARAAAARAAAIQERKRQEEAAVAAEAERVLERAMADHPVLRTPAGQPLLERIREQQRLRAARGTYPAVAMTEAIADHMHLLDAGPRVAQPLPAAEAPRGVGGCRWVTPTQWGCN